MRKLTKKEGVDVVFEHVGPDTFAQSMFCLKRGGMLVTCGSTTGVSTEINLFQLYQRQLRLIGSFGCNLRNLATVLDKMAKGIARPVIDTDDPPRRHRRSACAAGIAQRLRQDHRNALSDAPSSTAPGTRRQKPLARQYASAQRIVRSRRFLSPDRAGILRGLMGAVRWLGPERAERGAIRLFRIFGPLTPRKPHGRCEHRGRLSGEKRSRTGQRSSVAHGTISRKVIVEFVFLEELAAGVRSRAARRRAKSRSRASISSWRFATTASRRSSLRRTSPTGRFSASWRTSSG